MHVKFAEGTKSTSCRLWSKSSVLGLQSKLGSGLPNIECFNTRVLYMHMHLQTLIQYNTHASVMPLACHEACMQLH